MFGLAPNSHQHCVKHTIFITICTFAYLVIMDRAALSIVMFILNTVTPCTTALN